MKIIDTPINRKELVEIAKAKFGNLVKAVVDIDKKIMALDAELHADEEAALLEQGSKQQHLWGINLYPDISGSDWIEFDSMINVRPSQGNLSRGIDDEKIRERVILVVKKLIL